VRVAGKLALEPELAACVLAAVRNVAMPRASWSQRATAFIACSVLLATAFGLVAGSFLGVARLGL